MNNYLIELQTICREIYRASGVTYSEVAEKQIELYSKQGFANLPICMAKTHVLF
jgi:formyltetrahydrofolate synthetase